MIKSGITIAGRVIDGHDIPNGGYSPEHLIMKSMPSMKIDLSEWVMKVYWPMEGDPEFDEGPKVILEPYRKPRDT